jgi:hypothetical protein
MKNTHTTHTHKALGFVVESIREIRKDVTKGERAFADEKLYDLSRTVRSIQREQLPMDLEDARTEGSSFAYKDTADDLSATLYDICNPNIGECNLKP